MTLFTLGLPLSEVTLAEILQTEGYDTYHIGVSPICHFYTEQPAGKWHLGIGQSDKVRPSSPLSHMIVSVHALESWIRFVLWHSIFTRRLPNDYLFLAEYPM